jgi:hypothetical protein
MSQRQRYGIEAVFSILHVRNVGPQRCFESENIVSNYGSACTQFERKHLHHWKINVFPAIEQQQIDRLINAWQRFHYVVFTNVHKLGETCLRDICARSICFFRDKFGSDHVSAIRTCGRCKIDRRNAERRFKLDPRNVTTRFAFSTRDVTNRNFP